MRNKTKIIIRCTDEQKVALLQTKLQLKARTWLELIEKLLTQKKIDPPKFIVQDDDYLLEILTELKRCGNNLNQITRIANTNKAITKSETMQLKKLAMQISSLKSKVLKTFVIKGGK
ncbi:MULTISPECIES: plasmid mobilization relaxosome protein MobC [Vibrio]|uniref:plasmid mobilization relaxosome protein MobC n=1 Tax=Vibrio TaxID=662 RepID=UPI0005C938E6|nr:MULTISPECIES: plasmid mobilization relaxosome protein MobC [Vibrio]MCX9567603.1 plasmid mobilization relaxosome protein MobC [Vibrio cholerae]MCX9572159.1 plasmid mobilization relaxosome protein MobC [Vibrio cholerae]MCX9588607.1 plasmid mobilization relaxosome protein MobC [Vibrio cholerae]